MGLSQSDLLVKSAIEAGLHELRLRPEWLDYCFAWLPKDQLTATIFGENEASQARKWFMQNEIKVLASNRIAQSDLPCVTVTMLRDTETSNTLADLHYQSAEYAGTWPNLSDPFVPDAYSPATGILKLPEATIAQVYVVPGQVLVDPQGRSAVVREKLSREQIRIDANSSLEVSGLVVRGRFPAKQLTLRNAFFEESFLIGCHALDDQSRTIWLYNIVKFTLLRGRRLLLEKRGFDRSSISGSDLKEIQYFDTSAQPGFARYLTLTGSVLNVWVDDERDTPESMQWTWTFSARGSTGATEP